MKKSAVGISLFFILIFHGCAKSEQSVFLSKDLPEPLQARRGMPNVPENETIPPNDRILNWTIED